MRPLHPPSRLCQTLVHQGFFNNPKAVGTVMHSPPQSDFTSAVILAFAGMTIKTFRKKEAAP